MKTAKLHSLAKCTEDLLGTAAVGPEPSLNLSFLAKLFESRQTKDALLCGSFLFDWVKSEAWNDRATRGVPEINSVEISALSTESCSRALEADPLALVMDQTYQLDAPPKDLLPVLPTRNFEDRQFSAKLHCLYGISIEKVYKESVNSSKYTPRYPLRGASVPVHPYARSRVYDLRQHTDHTLWGPFLDEGSVRVDWEKMEALMIVLNYNIKLATGAHKEYEGCLESQDGPFCGVTPNSYISAPTSVPLQPALPLEAQDPYNITGTWTRIVCILDYTELYRFNFDSDDTPEDDQPRGPFDTEEATRLITMKLKVTKIAAPKEEDGQRLPLVHFCGTATWNPPHWDPNANSKIRGDCLLFEPL